MQTLKIDFLPDSFGAVLDSLSWFDIVGK